MPKAPLRQCAVTGCPGMAAPGSSRCEDHGRQQQQLYDADRGTSTERGYDARWRRARASYLRLHPLCVECERQGSSRAATVVDHITPHKGDQDLFWNTMNWQPLCAEHHNAKSARERAGVGGCKS